MFTFVVLDLVLSTKPRDWLKRTSAKWRILYRVGRRPYNLNQYKTVCFMLNVQCLRLCVCIAAWYRM